MKKFYPLILVFFLSLIISPTNLSGQDPRILPPKRTTPERAAEGRTKWMASRLKFDGSLYKIIYGINLKCEEKVDSIHLLTTPLSSKKESYLYYYELREKELKKALPSELYDMYQSIKEAIKVQATELKQQ